MVRLKYCGRRSKLLITVKCKDVNAIKSALAVYVSDRVAAVQTLKSFEFVLSPINDENKIDANKVMASIRDFLNSIGEEKNFAVIRNNDLVSIVSVDGKTLDPPTDSNAEEFFSCTHCGHVTQYESVHNNHVKIHYL